MRARDIVLAVFGWCCAAALVFELAHGRGKSVADYAARMPALAIGQPIDSSDDAHVIWSGWMRWKDGVRRSVAVDPDIAFASAVARNDCTVTLAAKPVLPDGLRAQRATISLNGAPPPALVEMAADGAYRFASVGNIRAGANQLSFRFPDARKPNFYDERLGAIDLRSIEISCASD